MSNSLFSLIIAAGLGTFAYLRVGRRLGYTNIGRVWTMVGAVIVLVFFLVITLLDWVLHITL